MATNSADKAISKDSQSLPTNEQKGVGKKYYATEDTVIVSVLEEDTLKLSKKEFNDIVDNFPQLYDQYASPPDIVYGNGKLFANAKDSSGNVYRISFGSELGQDNFYRLYAYFLRQRSRTPDDSIRRKTLSRIYNDINSLFQYLAYGGTYFGHLVRRIEGYTEYSIDWYMRSKDFFTKPYNISKQKEWYIASLRQLITDEEQFDNETLGKDKKLIRKRELLAKVNDLEKLISDYFYLKMAQSFQYENY